MFSEFEKLIRTEELINLENIITDISERSTLEDVIIDVKEQLARLENRFNLADFIKLEATVYSRTVERLVKTSNIESIVIRLHLFHKNDKNELFKKELKGIYKLVNQKLTNGIELVYLDFKDSLEPVEITTSEEAKIKLTDIYSKYKN